MALTSLRRQAKEILCTSRSGAAFFLCVSEFIRAARDARLSPRETRRTISASIARNFPLTAPGQKGRSSFCRQIGREKGLPISSPRYGDVQRAPRLPYRSVMAHYVPLESLAGSLWSVSFLGAVAERLVESKRASSVSPASPHPTAIARDWNCVRRGPGNGGTCRQYLARRDSGSRRERRNRPFGSGARPCFARCSIILTLRDDRSGVGFKVAPQALAARFDLHRQTALLEDHYRRGLCGQPFSRFRRHPTPERRLTLLIAPP